MKNINTVLGGQQTVTTPQPGVPVQPVQPVQQPIQQPINAATQSPLGAVYTQPVVTQPIQQPAPTTVPVQQPPVQQPGQLPPAVAVVPAPTVPQTDFLSQLNASFETAKLNSGEIVAIPDGKYQAQIMKMEYALSKANRPQIVTTYKLLDNNMAGIAHKSFDGLQLKDNSINEKGYGFLIAKMRNLGFEPTSGEDLIPKLAMITAAKPVVKITLVTKPYNGVDFQNTYIDFN